MPLIHSKRPAAFSKNVETEMEHGKPQKQAVAIAYKMAGEHKAKGGMCAHGGPIHCNAGCYSEGGEVGWRDDAELMGRKPSLFEDEKEPEGSDIGNDPELLAEGGEAGEGEEQLEHTLAEELLNAMEKKDKKGVSQAIEALVMQCLSKGEY